MRSQAFGAGPDEVRSDGLTQEVCLPPGRDETWTAENKTAVVAVADHRRK
jgi:hypothetical protein